MKSRPTHAVLISKSKDPFLMLDFSMSAIKNKIREHWRPSMLEMLQELVMHASNLPPLPYPRGPGAFMQLLILIDLIILHIRSKFC
jgi:hypothetical protein